MPTMHAELFAALAAPFDRSELKERTQGGRKLTYVTARTIMNRLDEVLGPERWWDRYPVVGENSVLCELTIVLPDGSTLTKCDAGGCAGMADSGDDDKSAFSDALKRAAVKFGVSRYLYRDGVPNFAREHLPAPTGGNGKPPAAPANGKTPRDWPGADNAAGKGQERPPRQSGSEGAREVPRTGKALFAWVKEQEQRHGVGLLKYLDGWARLQEFPARMVDWDAAQVELGMGEAIRKLSGRAAAAENN